MDLDARSPIDPECDEQVRTAIAGRDLDTLATLSDRLWHHLPAAYAPELLGLLADLPDTVVEARPRLLLAGLVAHQVEHGEHTAALPVVKQAVVTHGRRYARTARSFRERADVLAAGVCAVVSARMHGAHAEAQRLAEKVARHLETDAPAPGPWNASRTSTRPGLLELQQGVTAVLAGTPEIAVNHLSRSYAESGPGPFQHFAGAEAAAVLAMLATFRGHPDLAQTWLRRHEELGEVPGALRPALTLPARVARARTALDALDRVGAERWLTEAGDTADAGELWPFLAAVRAEHARLFGDPLKGLLQLDEACFAHGARADRYAPGGHVVVRARADLLTQAGEGSQVLHLAQAVPADLSLPVAQVYLRADDAREAGRIAARAIRDPATSPRDAVGLRLVLAAAQHRLGDADAARESGAAARRLGTSMRSTLVSVPLEDRVALADLGALAPEDTLPDLDGNHRPLPLVRLTRRETVVLHELVDGGTLSAVADRLGVSVHTVRSQSSSLYAKLGASSRADAIARAEHLGLLASRDRSEGA
ncbi:hypothetical protein GCM10009718_33430 [Isoptericola halotolerans]|uniref:LuxR family maltose regulon positive regulatory protein n=1 Tax=Isoptericola halotolerans TaxID=300560 RepID=A0ABX2A5C9_9MICO|nr:LuxR C-terminal-related transcriptional regulator [Isoptericola halotolerans]NOV96992.1 LuxR family maltose regulon positive regulatory protein [Isoptericola halotolerans]